MYTIIREYKNNYSIAELITKIISDSIKAELEQNNKSHNDVVFLKENTWKNVNKFQLETCRILFTNMEE